MKPLAGFQEIAHTADWELYVWAPDLLTLLEQSARGMFSLMSAQLQSSPRRERHFEIHFLDSESLLVSFLSELLLLCELEKLGFDAFDLKINADSLFAHLSGAPLKSISKEIKAVTYHNLVVRNTSSGLEANIVFDV
jgi:SHS2 domain-containing protein